jgi:hypothetical protein
MRPITYSLQFRGQATERGGGLRKEASAPPCALLTSLGHDGVEGHYVWAPDDDEAFLASTVTLGDDGTFDEEGTIVFSVGHAVRIRGRGRIDSSPDRNLRHGTIVWRVTGGEGRFEGASGRITSNFLLSDTGDLTENQLGVIFANGARGPSRGSVQGHPRRERAPAGETIDTQPDGTGSTRGGDR